MYIGILLRLILGYVRIEVEGYYIERFINICRNKKILIWNLKREKGVRLYLNIGIRDFKKLTEIARKTKCKINIQNKRGIPFILNKYKKRKIFAIFLIIISVCIYISSNYVWNIDVEVEEGQKVENIEKDLEEFGIKKGIRKKEINTSMIINELRLKRHDISWIGIDVKGTNVIVKIVKADEKPDIINNEDYCNIVANKDGLITKITAQNGTAVVKVGDTVKKGTVLIAGYMEGQYTDNRKVHSLGNIEAKVWYTESTKIPYKQEISTYTGSEEKKYQIKINNFQINFYKTLSKFEIYDTIYSEQNLELFSNYYLPISVIKITNKEQIKEEKTYNLEEAKSLGIDQLSKKIEEKIENKSTILRKNSKHRKEKRWHRSSSNL